MTVREKILEQIREVAASHGGPPGRQMFERVSGIRSSEWLGVHWARWGDALRDAGFEANQLAGKLDPDVMMQALTEAVVHFGRWPTSAERRLYRRTHPHFPSHSTFDNHFADQSEMIARLKTWLKERPQFESVLKLLPEVVATRSRDSGTESGKEGYVYLLESGSFFKVGRGEELERRVKQIRVALPDAATLVHAIRTDDPPGIETYWHRRFADKRANGEWFKLSRADVAAFKRRKFQ